MITVQNIERLHAFADTVLRKHGGNVERALPEFLSGAAAVVTPQILSALEYAAREYLTAYAKETEQRGRAP